jgi:Protein of unknown function (DUF3465)
MKKILFLVFISALAYGFVREQGISIPALSQWSRGSDSALQAALENKQGDVQVQGEGVVSRLLPDDNEGSRHQRFIVRLITGQTLLVAHNIDLAPRVTDLDNGDTVEFYGEYEWNPKGGVIHWTHHDPNNRHVGGWLKHRGNTYQ